MWGAIRVLRGERAARPNSHRLERAFYLPVGAWATASISEAQAARHLKLAIAMPVLVVLRSLFVTIVVGCAGDAVRLRSGDGVDHVVGTQDIVAHSPVVKNLIAELGASVEFVPLPNVNSTELQAVIPFVTRFEVHDVRRAS